MWINLEYLSAEPFAERFHGLPSPVMSGPAAGWVKHFHHPGFSPATGGLLREPDLLERQQRFDRLAWLRQHGVDGAGQTVVSLFCYEPNALPLLLQRLALAPRPHTLLVAHGRPRAAVLSAWGVTPAGAGPNDLPLPLRRGQLTVQFLPPLTQDDYDHLLWACDWNFVRGEDSWVRALWAAKPFVWQVYPLDDGGHLTKLHAFLERMDAPPAIRAWHTWWNAHRPDEAATPPDLDLWGADLTWAQRVAHEQSRLPDLASQLMAHVQAIRRA